MSSNEFRNGESNHKSVDEENEIELPGSIKSLNVPENSKRSRSKHQSKRNQSTKSQKRKGNSVDPRGRVKLKDTQSGCASSENSEDEDGDPSMGHKDYILNKPLYQSIGSAGSRDLGITRPTNRSVSNEESEEDVPSLHVKPEKKSKRMKQYLTADATSPMKDTAKRNSKSNDSDISNVFAGGSNDTNSTKVVNSSTVDYDEKSNKYKTKIGGDDEIEELSKQSLSPLDNEPTGEEGDIVSDDYDKLVFDPLGRFITLWRQFMMPVIIFNSINVPFRIAFGFDGNYGFFFILSYITDLVFIIDMFVSTRTGFYRHGILDMNPRNIWRHYVRQGWFLCDFIASIPFDLIQFAYGRVLPLTRVNKMIRVFQAFTFLKEQKQRPGADVAFIGFCSLLFYSLTFVHLGACGWYFISTIEGFGTNQWVVSIELSQQSLVHRYISSAFWVFSIIASQASVVSPETLIENVFTTFIILGGTLLFAYVIGSVCAVIDSRNETLLEHYAKMSYMNRFMKIRNLPKSFKLEVWNYYSFLWSTQRGFDTEAILADLPHHIRHDLYLVLFSNVLESMPMLKNIDETTIVQILSRMKSMVVSPGQYLGHAQETCRRMFVLTQGRCELVMERKVNVKGKDDPVVSVLSSGDCYGAHELFHKQKYKYSARAKTFCEVFVLKRSDLEQVFEVNPDCLAVVQKAISGEAEKPKSTVKRNTAEAITYARTRHGSVYINIPDGEMDKITEYKGKDVDLRQYARLLDPLGNAVLIWDFIILFVTLYNMLAFPFRFGFNWTIRSTGTFLIDILMDCVLWADIYVSMHRGFIYKGMVITSEAAIRKRYIYDRLKIDLIASLPIDTIVYFMHKASSSTIEHPFWRIFRLIRFRYFFSTLSTLFFRLGRGSNIVKACRTSIAFFLVIHWISAIYFSFTFAYGYGSTPWLPAASYEHQSQLNRYMRAIRFTLKVLTWKGPQVKPTTTVELFFTTFMIFIGIFLYAYIIYNVTSLVTNFDALYTSFNKRTVRAFQFLEHRSVSHQLISRVRRFYDLMWYQNRGVSADYALNTLPSGLHSKIMIYLCWDAIQKAPFFQNTSKRFQQTMATFLKFEIVAEGELVIVKGELGDRMFFILQGLVEVLLGLTPPSDKVVGQMGEGTFFGEVSILDPTMGHRRTVYIRAAKSCVFATLHKRDVITLIKKFPAFGKALAYMKKKRDFERKKNEEELAKKIIEDDGTVKPKEQSIGKLARTLTQREIPLLRLDVPAPSTEASTRKFIPGANNVTAKSAAGNPDDLPIRSRVRDRRSSKSFSMSITPGSTNQEFSSLQASEDTSHRRALIGLAGDGQECS